MVGAAHARRAAILADVVGQYRSPFTSQLCRSRLVARPRWTLRDGSDFRLSANGRDPFVARQILLFFFSRWLPPRLAKYGRVRFSTRAEIRRLRSRCGWRTELSGALQYLREPPPAPMRRWNCATVIPNAMAGRASSRRWLTLRT